jgi:hypothetical protein
MDVHMHICIDICTHKYEYICTYICIKYSCLYIYIQELSAFDLDFFEEIENLKYSHSELIKKLKFYESGDEGGRDRDRDRGSGGYS